MIPSIKKHFIAIDYECKGDKFLLHLIDIAKGIIKDSKNIDVSIQIYNIVQSFTEIRREKTTTKKILLVRGLRDFQDGIKIPLRYILVLDYPFFIEFPDRKDSFSRFLDYLFFSSPVFPIFGCILTVYAADALPTGEELVSDDFEISNAHTIQGMAEALGIEIRCWNLIYYIA